MKLSHIITLFVIAVIITPISFAGEVKTKKQKHLQEKKEEIRESLTWGWSKKTDLKTGKVYYKSLLGGWSEGEKGRVAYEKAKAWFEKPSEPIYMPNDYAAGQARLNNQIQGYIKANDRTIAQQDYEIRKPWARTVTPTFAPKVNGSNDYSKTHYKSGDNSTLQFEQDGTTYISNGSKKVALPKKN